MEAGWWGRLWLSGWEQREKNNLVIQSVLFFFVLFHGLLWQGGVNPCSGRKLCMWPASPFLYWWIMCHWDCVKTVQSGRWYLGLNLILTVHTVCQSEWDRQCLHWKEKYLCKHYLSSKYKVFFKNGLSHFFFQVIQFYFQLRIRLKKSLKIIDRFNILNIQFFST